MRRLDQKVDLLDRKKRFARTQPLSTYMYQSTHRLLVAEFPRRTWTIRILEADEKTATSKSGPA
jgi:hypothetical protein